MVKGDNERQYSEEKGKFPGDEWEADSLLEDWVGRLEPGRVGARSRPSSVFETVEAVAEVHLTGAGGNYLLT